MLCSVWIGCVTSALFVCGYAVVSLALCNVYMRRVTSAVFCLCVLCQLLCTSMRVISFVCYVASVLCCVCVYALCGYVVLFPYCAF